MSTSESSLASSLSQQHEAWMANRVSKAMRRASAVSLHTGRLLPHDEGAEQAVLGSLLLDDRAWKKVCDFLQARHFFSRRNGLVYAACGRVVRDGLHLDQVTVTHALDRAGELDAVGGPGYLSHLVATTPTPLHVVDYARIVERCWRLRQRVDVATQMVNDALAGRLSTPTVEGEVTPWSQ